MIKAKSWTDEELIEAVNTSSSKRQAIIKLGLVAKGGNYKTIGNHIKRLNLDTSHFKGQGWNKGLKVTCNPGVPIEEIIVEGSTFQTFHLKKRLLKENMLTNICSVCGIDSWQGQSLNMRLDHINGVSDDHRLENLQMICPNCDSQTDNYRGKNK